MFVDIMVYLMWLAWRATNAGFEHNLIQMTFCIVFYKSDNIHYAESGTRHNIPFNAWVAQYLIFSSVCSGLYKMWLAWNNCVTGMT